jgi:hypothetical protein
MAGLCHILDKKTVYHSLKIVRQYVISQMIAGCMSGTFRMMAGSIYFTFWMITGRLTLSG